MIALIKELQEAGDTTGGIITCVATGVPVGLGEPVFHKLQADLASAMLGINACKGFEIGDGFAGSAMRGSQFNDLFDAEIDPAGHPRFRTTTNHSGGIQGGISNGSNIVFRVAFKPVSTVLMEQKSVNSSAQPVTLEGKGRHDPCVVPRAVPIVEAMCALVLADHWLMMRSSRL
jgi:chorismate synthase